LRQSGRIADREADLARTDRRKRLAVAWGVVFAVAWGFVLGAGLAEAQAPIRIEMMVGLASREPGPVDPRAAKIDRRLKKEFRYESLKVLEVERERVPLDGVMTIQLPNGKRARVRPLSVDRRGVLLAVDIEGAVAVDARAPSGHLLVFGAGRHADGRLVVSVEPRFSPSDNSTTP